MNIRWLLGCALLSFSLLATASSAPAPEADPDATSAAIIALMKSGNAFIPKVSPSPMKCYDLYPTVADGDEPRIRDLLASMLGELGTGKNTIEGSCQSSSCHLNIYHANGEDVSSMELVFSTINGTADPASLECLMTP